MTAQEAFREILALFYQRLAHDPQARAAMRRVERQTAASTDTAQLSERASVLLGEVFGAHVLDVPEELREAVCTALLRERYDTMNGILADVQEAADEALGLSLDAAHAPFPAERVQTVAHSLIDPGVTAATIQRRANKPVATVARSFHDDFIETNAKKRSDLGLRCHITRETDGKCCPWCDDLAGRYVYGRHPGDIFRRHDNCGCTVTYEEGRQRQDVWTKRSWERVDPDEVAAGAPEPTILSMKDAAAMEERLLSGLTLAGERGIIIQRDVNADEAARALYNKMTPQERAEVVMRGIREPEPTFSYDRPDNMAMSYLKRALPEPNTFDVRAHGSFKDMEFFKQDYPPNDRRASIDAYTLATILRGRDDYKSFIDDCKKRGVDPDIRLLACSTGDTTNTGNCFAQLLANELGIRVKAPTDILFAYPNGSFSIGIFNDGEMRPFFGRK